VGDRRVWTVRRVGLCCHTPPRSLREQGARGVALFAENSMPTNRRDGWLATIANNMYYAGGFNGPSTAGPSPAATPFSTSPPANDYVFEIFIGCARTARSD
jgi:hypothetical protein